MASLVGVRAKIEHAKQHFEQVNTIVRAYVAKQDRGEGAQHEFQNGQVIVKAKVPEPPGISAVWWFATIVRLRSIEPFFISPAS